MTAAKTDAALKSLAPELWKELGSHLWLLPSSTRGRDGKPGRSKWNIETFRFAGIECWPSQASAIASLRTLPNCGAAMPQMPGTTLVLIVALHNMD
jgi:hypothetical protein